MELEVVVRVEVAVVWVDFRLADWMVSLVMFVQAVSC